MSGLVKAVQETMNLPDLPEQLKLSVCVPIPRIIGFASEVEIISPLDLL